MVFFINKKFFIDINDPEAISSCMEFIGSELKAAGISQKLAVRAQLLSEEMIAALIEHGTGSGDIRVRIKKLIGDISINISAKGEEFVFTGSEIDLSGNIGDDEAEEVIRSIIVKSFGDSLRYSNKNGINSVRIMTGRSGMSMMKFTIGALVLGLLFGLLLRFAMPEALSSGICDYLLSPVSTVFMNALQIVIAPVVFFSIVSCISGFGDLSELGRIGARVMGMYLLTTVISILVSYCVSVLLSPGEFGAALSMPATQTVDIDTNVDTSLLHTIMNIVPSNFVRPFLEADTLQLIFLALIVGIAVGKIGRYTPVLSDFFEACNSLFLTLTTMIAKFIPAAVFCSVSLMMVNLGGSSFLSLLGYFMTNVIAVFIMMIIYGLLVFVIGGLNPYIFFQKNREGMLTSFTLCSSSAAMPVNLRTCTEKLGISPKVCNFSIPLGATINMDGTCIGLVISGLYLAKMYGVTVTPSMMAPLAITIILLSLGCPGVPGAGLVCLAIVLRQLGVPIGAIGLVLAIDPILDMFDTMSNTTGDVACAAITASREGLLDREVYNDMSRI